MPFLSSIKLHLIIKLARINLLGRGLNFAFRNGLFTDSRKAGIAFSNTFFLYFQRMLNHAVNRAQEDVLKGLIYFVHGSTLDIINEFIFAVYVPVLSESHGLKKKQRILRTHARKS